MNTIRKHKKLVMIAAVVLLIAVISLSISPLESRFKGEMIVLAITSILSISALVVVFKEVSQKWKKNA